MKIHGYEKILRCVQGKAITYGHISKETGIPVDEVELKISELIDLGFPINMKNNKVSMKKGSKRLVSCEFNTVTSPSGLKGLSLSISPEYVGEIDCVGDIIQEVVDNISKIKKLLDKLDKIKNSTKNKAKNVRLNWDIGDIVYSCQNSLIKRGLYCFSFEENVLEKFIEGHTGSYWRLKKNFRYFYPKKEKLLPIGFDKYSELAIVKNNKKRKQLEDFVVDYHKKNKKYPSRKEIRNERWDIGASKKGSTKNTLINKYKDKMEEIQHNNLKMKE